MVWGKRATQLERLAGRIAGLRGVRATPRPPRCHHRVRTRAAPDRMYGFYECRG
jgi:hypothetical protein